MSVKKKFEIIDAIGRAFKSLEWNDGRVANYLEEYKDVGTAWIHNNPYKDYPDLDIEEGLRKASIETLNSILEDLEGDVISGNLPKEWDEMDEDLRNTRFIRVFISHLDENKDYAKSLADFLKSYNMKCFVAHADIKSPLEWPSEIKKALRTMECLIALNIKVSKQERFLKDSSWCMQEIGAAIVRSVPIINCCTKDQKKDVTEGKLGFLKDVQIFSLSSDKQKRRSDILEAIQRDQKIKNRCLEIENLIKQEEQKKKKDKLKKVEEDFDEIPF